jgi:hypothetical protein
MVRVVRKRILPSPAFIKSSASDIERLAADGYIFEVHTGPSGVLILLHFNVRELLEGIEAGK